MPYGIIINYVYAAWHYHQPSQWALPTGSRVYALRSRSSLREHRWLLIFKVIMIDK